MGWVVDFSALAVQADGARGTACCWADRRVVDGNTYAIDTDSAGLAATGTETSVEKSEAGSEDAEAVIGTHSCVWATTRGFTLDVNASTSNAYTSGATSKATLTIVNSGGKTLPVDASSPRFAARPAAVVRVGDNRNRLNSDT